MCFRKHMCFLKAHFETGDTSHIVPPLTLYYWGFISVMSTGGGSKSSAKSSARSGVKGSKESSPAKKMTKQRVKRRCCYGEHEKCAFIQKVFHHYDPTDAHIGYVWLTKSSGRFSSSSTRRYDKIRVAAECLGMNHEVDFNTQKRVATSLSPPSGPAFLWSGDKVTKRKDRNINSQSPCLWQATMSIFVQRRPR